MVSNESVNHCKSHFFFINGRSGIKLFYRYDAPGSNIYADRDGLSARLAD